MANRPVADPRKVQDWTFRTNRVSVTGTGGKNQVHHRYRPRRGYAWPTDPSLLGEVVLRGIAENA